ncbi:MAG: ImmA/IrrE family metallo-endopeptidase [Anaerolineae bacterium]|nr:ImmA/IrrE family metallo-endopeptidase [Anaerolineae bacterium]MCA9886720.1 ImmA/IrrE family metallo-endopeptidase [Anaerolineae bacterium]MCA9891345.1 ImmA/IrrE family metallo-endopeptidase [Anaerolineae bacterium]
MSVSLEQPDLVLMLRHIDRSRPNQPESSARDISIGDRRKCGIEKYIEDAIDHLGYNPLEFAVEHYIQYLRSHLRRDIDLVPMEFSTSLSGAYLRKGSRDHIFYNSTKHPVIQKHTVVHESAHIILNHHGYSIRANAISEDLQYLLVELVGHLRVRDPRLDDLQETDTGTEELEAELFAQLFLTRVNEAKHSAFLKRTANINLFPPFDS